MGVPASAFQKRKLKFALHYAELMLIKPPFGFFKNFLSFLP
jgi:hypothetical protein